MRKNFLREVGIIGVEITLGHSELLAIATINDEVKMVKNSMEKDKEFAQRNPEMILHLLTQVEGLLTNLTMGTQSIGDAMKELTTIDEKKWRPRNND